MMLLRFGGVVMGEGALLVTGFSPPVIERDSDEFPRLNDHGTLPSREWLRRETWAWSLATNGRDLREAMGAAGAVKRAWADRDLMDSTRLAPLEYSLDGGVSWFRVLGRPGRFTPPDAGVLSSQGVGVMDVEFRQMDPRHYGGREHRESIPVVPASLGGLVAPLVAPLTTVSTGAARAGRVVNAGDLPAPLAVEFRGPATDPVVVSDDGLEIGYRGTLAYDESVMIDPVANSVLLNGSVPVPGRLTLRTRLSRAAAPPGESDWFFRALDQTGTAEAVLIWRDAYSSMQYGEEA